MPRWSSGYYVARGESVTPDKEVKASLPASDAKLSAIRALEAAGFPLIPLKGKIPVGKNWGATPVGKFTSETLAVGNYGVVLSAGYLVLDIDPRRFVQGDKPVTRLAKDLNVNLSGSFSVKTGGGGLHIYFKMPADSDIRVVNELEKYRGVEFKSAGRQVVGPGSIHPETNIEYKISVGSPDKILEAPAALLELIKAPAAPKAEEKEKGVGDYKNDEGSKERFISYLKETAKPSIEGQNGDANAFLVAAYGRDLGLAPDITFDLMIEHWNPKCSPIWGAEELKIKVVNAYKYAGGALGSKHPETDFTPLPTPPTREEDIKWDYDGKGNLKRNFVNLLNYLKAPSKGLAQIFGHNEFTARIEFCRPAPWHNGAMPRSRTIGDNDLKMLKGYLAVNCKFEVPIGLIEEAVVITANANKFHPVREYLTGLVWDNTPRLDTWLHDFCGAAKDDYTAAVGRKILVAAVMRVFKPGCKFDHVAVFEGDQGIGKSGICAILGGEWSGDFAIDPHSKDTIQLMQGKWIIELAELEVVRRADNDALKAFVSRQIDTARLAYGRLASEFPRQSILIASKNPGADGAYLKDETGNRRWWPVALKPVGGKVDFKGLKAVRNQLFAEAMELAKKGERLGMDTPALETKAKEIVQARHADHPWSERITAWVDKLPKTTEFLTSRDVFIGAMDGMDKQLDHKASIAVSSVLKSLGWVGIVKRFGPRVMRVYKRPVSDGLEGLL